MKKHYTLLSFTILFALACGVQKLTKREVTYKKIQKQDEEITLSYVLPSIKPTSKTPQMQTKGGVVISVELMPFTASKTYKETTNVTYSNSSNYDKYETKKVPTFTVTPNDVSFKIRIRNNEDVPLQLSGIGFAFNVDGVQWSFPDGYLQEWNKGMILTGYEKEYIIKGPKLLSLADAQIVHIFLNGVPVSYNEAGEVTKKQNFQWFFECTTKTITKKDMITYKYHEEKVHEENCSVCKATGFNPTLKTCSRCKGNGQVYSAILEKNINCGNCKGTGKLKEKCSKCYGAKTIKYPKSTPPPVEKAKYWNGHRVKVITKPSGATVQTIDTRLEDYGTPKSTPEIVDWYFRRRLNKPLVITYQGMEVKVFPHDDKGEPIGKVVVDFSSGSPIVEKGTLTK